MGEEAEEGPVIGLTAAIFVDDKLPGKTPETIGYSAANNRVYHENPKIGKLSPRLQCKIVLSKHATTKNHIC